MGMELSECDDASVKTPSTALLCTLNHCGVLHVRLIPQALRALYLELLRKRQQKVFCHSEIAGFYKDRSLCLKKYLLPIEGK
ncbi:MAG: hypothetical protein ABIN18_03325 [Pseudomonadota bacterium]